VLLVIATANIRAATADDLPRIERLLTESDLPLAGVREALESFVVAEADGDIVGVAGLEVCCDDALLRSVAVLPEWRSRGVGRAVVTHAIAEAESRGIRALYLLTTTAEHYFPSFGFTKIARADVPEAVRATREFSVACPASAAVMCRSSRVATHDGDNLPLARSVVEVQDHALLPRAEHHPAVGDGNADRRLEQR
jgi:amino-acid N-acetyltransferase